MKSNPVLLKLEANLRASEALAEYQRRRIECLTRQLEWIAKRLSDLKQCPKLDNGDYLYEYTGDCDNNCPECWSIAAEVDTYEEFVSKCNKAQDNTSYNKDSLVAISGYITYISLDQKYLFIQDDENNHGYI